MSLQDKNIVILLEDLYQEMEVWYPYYRLKEEEAEVFFVGPKKGMEYHSKLGYPAKAELGVDEIQTDGCDAVIVPGGYAPDRMRQNSAMVRLVREMSERGKIVAAICHGGWMLASAEIIRGKRVTCVAAIKDDLVHAGAHYVDEEVARDGNIITSRTPADLPAFSRSIIDALAN
jgi:protease I